MDNSIKIFTFIKDEEIFIIDWIEYHANIVGYKNLHIVDNKSTDNTINILKEYEKLGVNVIYDYPDYSLKGEYLSQIMKELSTKCKYLIPIDGDEFIALKTNEVDYPFILSVDPDKIRYHLRQLQYNGAMYLFYSYICCISEKSKYDDPLIEIETFDITLQKHELMKKFYPSVTFISTDHGNHIGKVKSNFDTILSNLVLFHYHDVGFDSYIKRIYNDLIGFNYPVDDIEKLKLMLDENPKINGASSIWWC